MASPPSRTDLAGTPTVATYKLAIGGLYDYVASLLGNGTATIASETEKKLARENLGVGSFGFKNRLVNPEFLISQQYGAGGINIASGVGIVYTVDQWYASANGSNVVAQQIAGIGLNKYSLRLNGSNSNTAFMLGQRIESNNCADLKNKDVTVSLNSKSTSARTLTWTAYYANVQDVFSSKTTIASGTIDITTITEKYNFTFNAGSNAGNGIAIEFSGGALLLGSTIDFDAVQLEDALIATEFEKRSIQTHLALCQRYYEVGSYRYRGYDTGSATIVFDVRYKVTKRAVATLTGASGLPGASLNTIDVFSVQLTGTGVLDTGGIAWTASARL